jgi:hypothetical protein
MSFLFDALYSLLSSRDIILPMKQHLQLHAAATSIASAAQALGLLYGIVMPPVMA